jgi:hypothetical protein
MNLLDSKWVKSIWKSDSTSGLPDTFKAKRLVTESYESGLINWNTYNLALDRIRRVQNGDWMFDKHKKSAAIRSNGAEV